MDVLTPGPLLPLHSHYLLLFWSISDDVWIWPRSSGDRHLNRQWFQGRTKRHLFSSNFASFPPVLLTLIILRVPGSDLSLKCTWIDLASLLADLLPRRLSAKAPSSLAPAHTWNGSLQGNAWPVWMHYHRWKQWCEVSVAMSQSIHLYLAKF